MLLNLSLDFEDNITAPHVEQTVTAMEKEIKTQLPEVKRIFTEAQSAV